MEKKPSTHKRNPSCHWLSGKTMASQAIRAEMIQGENHGSGLSRTVNSIQLYSISAATLKPARHANRSSRADMNWPLRRRD